MSIVFLRQKKGNTIQKSCCQKFKLIKLFKMEVAPSISKNTKNENYKIPLFIIFVSCIDSQIIDKDPISDEIVDNNSYLINNVSVDSSGILVFKNQVAYKEISEQLSKISDKEFQNWEKAIGFTSACTYLNNIYDKIELATTESEAQSILRKNNYYR